MKTKSDTPKSPCCSAIMYARMKDTEFGKRIDYIYCSECNHHLDGNGKRITPPKFHKN